MAAMSDATMKPLIMGTRSIIAWQQGKTQTRRLVRPLAEQKWWKPWQSYEGHWRWYDASGFVGHRLMPMRQPYAVGDLLWIREALCVDVVLNRVNYTADNQVVFRGEDIWAHWPWKRPKLPAMFMPRWACRYYARVLSVRPERLQDISEEDMIAEGTMVGIGYPKPVMVNAYHGTRQNLYLEWWDSLHKKPGTRSEDNPWVWVYGLEAADASSEA